MTTPGGVGTRAEESSPVRPVAAIVLSALAVSWMILTILDLRENDGAGPIIAMFGIPALAASVIIQIVMTRLGDRKRVPKAVFWWVLAVLPLGTLGGFVVALIRDPEYFIADDGPWMLVWVPIFIIVGLLLGALVWFFFVFPLVSIVTVIRLMARGEAKGGALIMPLVLMSLGVMSIVGGLSIDTESSGRASWGSIIAAFFGLPGRYEVLWEPGMWIVRGIVLAIVLVFAVPAALTRLRSR
ncbi:hypothetical protein [Microbacterium sp. BLY]|uniref:hypothetical protein n=1 Tax=Microbacterium sp. BLY TaxID=2823280 RepID=UPI001B32BADE|nr:hypothetical protein [Microbacterium sp. BLY]MBP3976588.1 hypothetical protein [Microbacterium sp. BLY]